MYKSKSILVCVPARHGSKSIKNKNLQKVGNETLVARSIRHAKSSKFVDEVVVSTNSDKIKKEALSHGAKVLDRPESISGPLSSTDEAMVHLLSKYNADFIVTLQATSPFRSKDLVDRCIARTIDENGDSLATCWKFHNFCFYKVLKDGHWFSTFDYQNRPMRQQLSEADFMHFEAGNLYVTRVSFLKEHKCRLGGKIIIQDISQLESMQIDEHEELEMCQKIANGGAK